MSMIPCSLNCKYQIDGVCELKLPSAVSLKNEKCPHFVERKAKSKNFSSLFSIKNSKKSC